MVSTISLILSYFIFLQESCLYLKSITKIIDFSDLLPDTVYQVRVLAATKAGYGRIDQKDWPWVDYRTPSRGDCKFS
jgi:hypothetical protein